MRQPGASRDRQLSGGRRVQSRATGSADSACYCRTETSTCSMRPVRVIPSAPDDSYLRSNSHPAHTHVSPIQRRPSRRRGALASWRLRSGAKSCRLQVCRHHLENCQEVIADTRSPRPRRHLRADRRTVPRETPILHTSRCCTRRSRNPTVARRRSTAADTSAQA